MKGPLNNLSGSSLFDFLALNAQLSGIILLWRMLEYLNLPPHASLFVFLALDARIQKASQLVGQRAHLGQDFSKCGFLLLNDLLDPRVEREEDKVWDTGKLREFALW